MRLFDCPGRVTDTRSVALLDPSGQLPFLQWEARSKLASLASRFYAATGLHLKVRPNGGRRTCAEQDALYAQGRTSGGEIITYAPGCTSWHVVGRAADVDPVTPAGVGQPATSYASAGALWESMGGVWGGNFSGFADIGHFEWHPGLSISMICPNSSYCAAVQASIQTHSPWAAYAAGGIAVGLGALWVMRWRRAHS